ncbi:MAG TPA: metallophosphoesterase family protein, partial [Clostridiales bacterium]|nr:metallophosphoesterase family protein [Clostridiales bacterium]
MTEIKDFPETLEQWRGHWEGILDKGGNPFLCPGADDTKRNIVWTSRKDETEPFVLLSENSSLDDAKRIKARRIQLPNSVVDTNHAELCGLLPNKTYYYRCVTNQKHSEIYSFNTKGESDIFSCIYISDVHVGSSKDNPEVLTETGFRLHKVFLEALSHRPDISMILSGGDQASSGKADEYRAFSASPVLSEIPINCIVGNHDKKNFVYTYFFNNPNYKIDGSHSFIGSDHWFTHNNALFLCIDSNNSCLGDHIKTFETAFSENPGCKWKILMIHHDLYGGH